MSIFSQIFGLGNHLGDSKRLDVTVELVEIESQMSKLVYDWYEVKTQVCDLTFKTFKKTNILLNSWRKPM